MKITLPQIAGHDVLTSSRMSCYRTCQRKHWYAYTLGVRPEGIAHYFRLGHAFHLGLDLRSQGMEKSDAIAGAVATYENYPDWAKTEEQKHEWLIERETVMRLLLGYWWYWERAEIRPDLRVDEIIETEGSFRLPIRNPETGASSRTFDVAGKRDKIVRLGDGRVAVMEHKTTGDDLSPTSSYWKKLNIDQQISLYMLAAKEQGFEVSTVLYDAVRKPGIKPREIPVLDENGLKIVIDPATGERMFKVNIKKNGEPGAGHGEPYQSANAEKGWIVQTRIETPTEFGDRLTDDIAAFPEWYFARKEIPRLEMDLEEFKLELWQMSQQIRESQDKGRAFRNTSACLLRGECQYLGICHQGIDIAAGLPAGFRQTDTLHEELDQ